MSRYPQQPQQPSPHVQILINNQTKIFEQINHLHRKIDELKKYTMDLFEMSEVRTKDITLMVRNIENIVHSLHKNPKGGVNTDQLKVIMRSNLEREPTYY